MAKDLDWRPIQSFGWQIPPFKTLTLSVQRLRTLAAAGKVNLPEGFYADQECLRGCFCQRDRRGLAAGDRCPQPAGDNVQQSLRNLEGHAGDPEVRQFVALRLAAWLRYVFAHMRSCLIGALGSGLLALIGVTAYSFQPRHFVSLAIWIASLLPWD